MKDCNHGGVNFSERSLVAVSNIWGEFSVPRCAIKLPDLPQGTHWLSVRLEGLTKQGKEVAGLSIASTLHTAQTVSPHSLIQVNYGSWLRWGHLSALRSGGRISLSIACRAKRPIGCLPAEYLVSCVLAVNFFGIIHHYCTIDVRSMFRPGTK